MYVLTVSINCVFIHISAEYIVLNLFCKIRKHCVLFSTGYYILYTARFYMKNVTKTFVEK